MNTLEALSAAIMVLALFSLWSAIVNTQPLTALAAAVLVAQYPAMQFYTSYRDAEAPAPDTAEAN